MSQLSQAAGDQVSPRRHGAVGVHSLTRFVFTVPELDSAEKFYREFGLDVRRIDGRLDLYTFGHPHRWASIYANGKPKKLQYLSFGTYHDDLQAVLQRMRQHGATARAPHELADDEGHWFSDPEGIAIQVHVADKVSPSVKQRAAAPAQPPAGYGNAPKRSAITPVHPRRLSHLLLFSSDVPRSSSFYCGALGLQLSDKSGDGIAFLHGPHGSDHHLIALAKSDGPALHHSSWDVARFDDVGNGMEQMYAAGHRRGWGVGRHVLGSNYFYYVCDPWGSFAEYSYDIDHVPADVQWQSADHPPEDSFYLWGPAVPDYFVMNHETAAARG